MSDKVKSYDISLCQGSDYKLIINLKDQTTGLPIDITGWTFASDIKKTISTTTIEASFTFLITDAVNGVVEMSLDNATSSALLLPKQDKNIRTTIDYAYDVERVDSLGDKQRFMQGLVKISPEVTI